MKHRRPGKKRSQGRQHPLLTKLLRFAVSNPELARELVAVHPEILTLRTELGETALHCLASANEAVAIQLLITLGADVNARNEFGMSALTVAAYLGASQAVDVLRRAGAVE